MTNLEITFGSEDPGVGDFNGSIFRDINCIKSEALMLNSVSLQIGHAQDQSLENSPQLVFTVEHLTLYSFRVFLKESFNGKLVKEGCSA